MTEHDSFQRNTETAEQPRPRRRRYHPEAEQQAENGAVRQSNAADSAAPQFSQQHYAAPAAHTYHAQAPYDADFVPQHSPADPPHVQRPSEKTPASQKKTNKDLTSRILLIVCACVFAVSAFLLIRYFVNIAITRVASSQLEEVYSSALQNEASPTALPTATPEPVSTPLPAVTAPPEATKTPVHTAAPLTESTGIRTSTNTQPSASELWPGKYPGNPTLRISSVFYELQRQNKDIIGWLKIDGVLEEAVLQRDNEYYLTHNALGQRSVTGALFLDESCNLKNVPTQMLIHGHNMKEGAMFGSLKKYKVKDASFYRAHSFIDFNTIYENSRYVIFAVAEVDIRWDRADYLPFWRDVRFNSADLFMEYVNDARNLSHYRCNVDVQPGDRLLTLSTCTGNDDNKRLIIMARRLRDGENELELKTSILTTSDR